MVDGSSTTVMKGKLIIIDGTDGSGKTTQTNMLYQRLYKEDLSVRKFKFPDYDSDSSALVKMYLAGELGAACEVNPYAAAAFYAVDRYASFKTKWGDFYLSGGVIIADRYTTSNMIHQTGKFNEEREKESFLMWLEDFEFQLFELPRPDGVIFLDMPPGISTDLLEKRQKETGICLDVHEKDPRHYNEAYVTACEIACRYGWHRVRCTEKDRVREINEIHDEIYHIVKKILD